MCSLGSSDASWYAVELLHAAPAGATCSGCSIRDGRRGASFRSISCTLSVAAGSDSAALLVDCEDPTFEQENEDDDDDELTASARAAASGELACAGALWLCSMATRAAAAVWPLMEGDMDDS